MSQLKVFWGFTGDQFGRRGACADFTAHTLNPLFTVNLQTGTLANKEIPGATISDCIVC